LWASLLVGARKVAAVAMAQCERVQDDRGLQQVVPALQRRTAHLGVDEVLAVCAAARC
jgi:hypothetical protein